MARISGIDLPRDKRIEVALTYIYGIGPTRAAKVLEITKIDPDTRVKDLTEDQEGLLREAIEKNYHIFSPLMSDKGRQAVNDKGFFEIDMDGDMVTPLVPGSEECAYTLFDEEGNCFCSMERCWFQGKGDFRKPISCWLYPIRITQLSNGTRALNLHRWHICQDAFARGKKEKIRVYEFLREPIERYFGEDFYEALCEAAKRLNGEA